MVTKPTVFQRGERVQVKRLSGWKAATVVDVARLGGGRELYHAAVDGEKTARPFRPEQMRRPAQCPRCVQLADENRDLRTENGLLRSELRKWVNAG